MKPTVFEDLPHHSQEGYEYVPFQRVVASPSGHTVLCRMSNGKENVIHLHDIRGTDRTSIKSCRISRNRDYVLIAQQSGNKVDVPWDAVLYHAEPEYPYYKARPEQQQSERESAQRIAARICALRKRRGLTVTALAAASGIARPNLSRLERGAHTPSLPTLERIAKALGVPVARLVATK
jgi:DNA-binding XRE family transcriptional regulator